MEPTVWYVKYVGGSGVLFQIPLSDGQVSFKAGLTYQVKNYDDFVRLTLAGDFVEVDSKGHLPKPAEKPKEEKAEKTPVEKHDDKKVPEGKDK